MATTITVSTENLDTLAFTYPTQATHLQALAAPGGCDFASLDVAEAYLRGAFPLWFVYRGGNHVALHAAPGVGGGPRVLLVAERVVNDTLDFKALKAAVVAARSKAQREARSEGRKLTRKTISGRVVPAPCKFIRSRGASLVALDARGRCKAFDEPWTWDGTKAQLVEALAVALTQTPEADSLDLFGGFDLSETFDFADYEPQFTEWGVTVWTRAGGWAF